MKRLVLTGFLLAVLLAAVLWMGREPAARVPFWLRTSPPWLLLTVAGMVIILGGFFRQSGPAFLAVFLLAVFWAAGFDEPGRRAVAMQWISLLAPVNFGVFFLLPERGMVSLYGVVRLVWVCIQGIAVRILPQVDAAARHGAWRFPGGPLSDEPVTVAPAAWLLLVAAVIVLTVPVATARMQRGWLFAGALALVFLGLLDAAACATLAALLPGWTAAAIALLAVLLTVAWDHAFLDETTGLPGRRALALHLARLHGNYVLMMVDADRFKRINDRYGHDVGDQVLRFLAARLRQFKAGRVYRYGGEEFTIVCRAMDTDAAVAAAQKLRLTVQNTPFILRSVNRPARRPRRPAAKKNVDRLRLTVSIGIAGNEKQAADPWDVVRAADRALYTAKRRGRNRVVAAT